MEKEEFETALIARVEDIRALYKQYNPQEFESPNAPYLSISIYGSAIMCNNRYFDASETNPARRNPVNIYKMEGNV